MERLPIKSQKSLQLVASLTDPIGEMGDPSNINQQDPRGHSLVKLGRNAHILLQTLDITNYRLKYPC